MGWVSYVEGFECAVHNQFGYDKGNNEVTNNWNAHNKGLCTEIGTDVESPREYTRQMDELIKEGMPCNIVYIREPWSWFEPEEGKCAWKDENSACYEIVNWARKNNIQLAFRIITCSSACAQQATPQWVFKAGATGVTRDHDYVKNVTDPYLDNEVFQTKFKNFTKALGEEFNNEGTAFVDAHGHGQWGEMNALVDMQNEGNRKQAIQYLEDCFVEAFPDVLLGGQQGSSKSGGAIEESFAIDGKNFVVRRDAFGSYKYLYDSGNAATIKGYRQDGIPVFAENCYHHFDSRNFRWSNKIAYSSGSTNEYGGDNPFISMKDMMNKVVNHALDCGANTLDLRTLEDAKLWMENGEEILDRFTQEGGYRISVSDATYTKQLNPGDTMTIDSSWMNNGLGIVPNNNIRWNKKMKVSFALIDESGKIVQQEIISTDNINVGDIDKDESHKYKSSFKINKDVAEGQYKLAVSVINTKDNNKVGIQLANKGEKTNDGWLTLENVRIGENVAPTIEVSDKSITVGDEFDPLEGVSATDNEDKDLTSKMEIINNTVDTTKVGQYEVTYRVTDNQGASATKTIIVIVKNSNSSDTTTTIEDGSGVTIILPENALEDLELKVTTNTTEVESSAIEKVVKIDGDKIKTFDLSLLLNGNIYEYNGQFTTTVSLPIPEGWDMNKLALYYFNEDTKEVEPDIFNVDKDNGTVVFNTNHFSKYVLIQKDTTNADTTQTTNPPKTDDKTNVKVLTTIFTISTLGIAALELLKKKRINS